MFTALLQPRMTNFNPRSHEGSDTYNNINKNRYFISIHAPTRGATYYIDYFLYATDISIHAPTRGATLSEEVTKSFKAISIHAPTRGATPRTTKFTGILGISIHAPTRGATAIDEYQAARLLFQSTLPRGERR